MKILIAEDNQVSQILLKKILLLNHHEVSVAANGLIAWKMLGEGLRPDLCILDIMMPELDGVELLKRIRGSMEFKDMRVILCSALRDKEIISEGARLGISSFILKPYKTELIQQRVQEALKDKLVGDVKENFKNFEADDETKEKLRRLMAEKIAPAVGDLRTSLAWTRSAFKNASSGPFMEHLHSLLTQLDGADEESSKLMEKLSLVQPVN